LRGGKKNRKKKTYKGNDSSGAQLGQRPERSLKVVWSNWRKAKSWQTENKAPHLEIGGGVITIPRDKGKLEIPAKMVMGYWGGQKGGGDQKIEGWKSRKRDRGPRTGYRKLNTSI